MYGVAVNVLNQVVRRKIERFSGDFMFRLIATEHASLRSQSVAVEKRGRGQHRKVLPLAFTERGSAMLSGVLRSVRAIQVDIELPMRLSVCRFRHILVVA